MAWPDGFGLERMRALLAELGDPQLRYPAIHVVGTNGKSTTTRLTEALLADAGLAVGAYISPHVRGWSERIRVGGAEADFERAVAAVRPAAERPGATQFEALTAAALAAFADAEVDVAVVEAGLGGRHDATNVLDTRVVVLTNVALDHMDVLGDTREAIAAEKLAVVQPGLRRRPRRAGVGRASPTRTAPPRVERHGAQQPRARRRRGGGVPRPAGRPAAAEGVALPGRLERRGEHPLEIWDGAHNLAGVGYLLPRLPGRGLRRRLPRCSRTSAPELMLEALSVLGGTLVATQSPNARALPAEELAAPRRAVLRARRGGPRSGRRPRPRARARGA